MGNEEEPVQRRLGHCDIEPSRKRRPYFRCMGQTKERTFALVQIQPFWSMQNGRMGPVARAAALRMPAPWLRTLNNLRSMLAV
jgi:hypothetical protein